MKTTQVVCSDVANLQSKLSEHKIESGFGLFFSSIENTKKIKQSNVFNDVKFPVIGCSTSGEISDDGVSDDQVVFTLCEFQTPVEMKVAQVSRDDHQNIFETGKALANQLQLNETKLVVVFGIGVDINGSELVRGLQSVLGEEMPITGGLAGDNAQFAETFVGLNGTIINNGVVAMALSGDQLQIGFGSRGGWKPFGPERSATKAENNILYSIDGEPALDIYKTYLGDKVKDLPASGLLYPFSVRENDSDKPIIRTILGIDEEQGSLILAGEIKEGSILKLMHAGTDALVEGAENAADLAKSTDGFQGDSLAILVSCVGRKIVMGSDIDDEVDVVKETLGDQTIVTGFYSHGEICPLNTGESSLLHNQTMTITTISEK